MGLIALVAAIVAILMQVEGWTGKGVWFMGLFGGLFLLPPTLAPFIPVVVLVSVTAKSQYDKIRGSR